MNSPMTETEFLLCAARTIAQRQMPDASEVLIAEVFRRLCLESDIDREARDALPGLVH